MPRWIDSLGPKRIIIGFLQGIITMNSSKDDKDLSIMANYVCIPSRRRGRQRIHALSMQDFTSLMAFLWIEIQKYPSSTTSINSMITWSGMEFGMSSTSHTHAINRRRGIFLYISIYFLWTTWNAMYRVFRKSLRQIIMLFRTWRGQEYSWGLLWQIIFFRRYLHWCHLKQPDLRYFSPL